jgi:hypothetical protein
VIRSDAGDAHRLSLSARVLSTMPSQVKAKPTAAEALLTSMKTALQRCIWPLRIAAATGPRVIILRARKAASGVESVKAIWRGSWVSKVAATSVLRLSLANYTRILLAGAKP